MKLNVGTFLNKGKYQIDKVLGQGGFGITYLATVNIVGTLGTIASSTKVAIKEFFMRDINGRKEDGVSVDGSTGSIFTNYKQRFRKEAEHLANLKHPNIVEVFDVFDENNTTYYVMEYLSDTNLNKYIKSKNGLSEKECIALTEEIGEALQYMHDRLMLHLDLKPDNIMLRNNEVVLIDFGLSKQFNANGRPETSTNIGLGTPGYAPLEQQNYNGSKSKGMPFAMDVYALGGTMFKMITGQTPPDASSIYNDGFPRNELERHNVSKHLIDVIEKGMSPKKEERYSKVAELLKALEPLKKVSKQQSEPVRDSSESVDKKSEDLTELKQVDSSEDMTLSDSDAALKVGSTITSPNGNKYIVDRSFIGGWNFTYFCHYSNNPNKKIVVRELFFRDYNYRKNGIVSSLGRVDLIDRYHNRFSEFANTLSGHPHIETYVDSFKTNGTYYVVTDFIYGETLSDIQRRKKGNFTEKEVVDIVRQICIGLGYLRTHNILHLDIKPSNIIKSKNRYILLDFGLNRMHDNDDSSGPGYFLGYTPGYSSIEQYSWTGNLSSASDVYSLGATMYKLLTGHTPKSAPKIISEGFEELESELKKNNVSGDLIKVIRIAMFPIEKHRYQSPASLSKALATITFSKKDEEIHKTDKTQYFVDSVADFLENIWNSTWTPILSLIIFLVSLIVVSDIEKKYLGVSFISISLSILLINICSLICDKTLDDRIRRICACFALFAISIYSFTIIASFFYRI